MDIRTMQEEAHFNADQKGFYEDLYLLDCLVSNANSLGAADPLTPEQYNLLYNNAIATRLLLCVTEIAEATEALRRGDPTPIAEELADIVIRVGDLCGELGVDLEAAIEKKMKKNQKRSNKHGKLF